MQDILIESLMTTEVKCTSPATPLSEVVRTMRTNRHSCMVITENQKPVGIITERDIIKHFADLMQKGREYNPPAVRLMSGAPVTVATKATLLEALVIAKSNEIRHLPVIDGDGDLVGLVTQTNLVAAYFRVVETQTQAVDRAVANRTQGLLEANMKLRELMLEDPLLRMGNRRAMEIDLAHTHAAARRYRRPYSVILCDIDHFKLYNDHYGHAAGDKALQDIAVVIKQSLRKSDRVYRYGGEELLLLLPETMQEGAEDLGQRLLQAVVKRAIPHVRHSQGILTLSGGISCVDAVDAKESWNDVVERADNALYQAKSAGRNRVVSFAATDLGDQPLTEPFPTPAWIQRDSKNVDPTSL